MQSNYQPKRNALLNDIKKTIQKTLFLICASTLALTATNISHASELPLFSIENMSYEGAFRMNGDDHGESTLRYASGAIGFNPVNNSLYIVGHDQHHGIAEFPIPALSTSTNPNDLNLSYPTQPFSRMLKKVANPQSIDRVSGLYFHEGRLIINSYLYYDASGSATNTTLVVDNPNDLVSSSIQGFYDLQGQTHASGWMSPVPTEWQTQLGGSHITGHSSGVPIITRHSVGPSAFIFDPNDIGSTTALLDFSFGEPLHSDLYNKSLTNKLWTHATRAVYGVIVPGTRTYMTVGWSQGHESGIGYKITQWNGNVCGGYCTYDPNDRYNYYWLWDVNDMIKVKNGTLASSAVRPYGYGILPTRYGTNKDAVLGGGAYDPATGILYLSVLEGDTTQGTYGKPPLIEAYQLNIPAPAAPKPNAPAQVKVQ